MVAAIAPGNGATRDPPSLPRNSQTNFESRTSNQPPKTTDFRRQPRLFKGHCSGDIPRLTSFLTFRCEILPRWSLQSLSRPYTTACITSPRPVNCPAPRFRAPVPDVPRLLSKVPPRPGTVECLFPDSIRLATALMTRYQSPSSVPPSRRFLTRTG